jgi:hypothetical protein
MAVVFDEVTASVEPETRSVTEEKKGSAKEENEPLKLRHLLCKLEQRQARLKAD